MMTSNSGSIPFKDFSRLCFIMGQAALKRNNTQSTEIFTKFTDTLRNEGRNDVGNGRVIMQLLFPEEDTRRKFGMQETRLLKVLVKILEERGVSGRSLTSLGKWAGTTTGVGRTGCLGEEVKKALQGHSEGVATYQPTIHDINALLEELADHSRFTQSAKERSDESRRPQIVVLRDLYRTATPEEASLITQIILKDLRPIVSPLKTVHTTSNLLERKHTDPPLTVWQAMKIWHPMLPSLYRVYASIPDVFNILESGTDPQLEPIVGIPVQAPKCRKGRSCRDVLSTLNQTKRIFCETKYDGERMQIHVDLTLPFERQITVFSKSRRDSTLDRFGTHEIIRAALGVQQPPITHPDLKRRVEEVEPQRSFNKSIIVEAEMVAFSEKSDTVDEFWRIRGLIASTAKGVRGKSEMKRLKIAEKTINRPSDFSESGEESTPEAGPESVPTGYSLESNGSDNGDRHLQLVFFDVLHVDGRGLLGETYATRRRLLQDIITVVPGFAVLAARTPIDMVKGDPCRALQNTISSSIAQFEEGLVIKAEESTYNSQTLPWVKLKRDYIPGLYDCIDMAVIGASWNKERARELQVGTDTFTTFYVAALFRKPERFHEKPIFECLFTVSYGLSKEQLERLNFEIKSLDPIPFHSNAMLSISYNFNLCPGRSPPSVLFRTPMLFELFGAGFDKPPRSKYYAIRWPRISKVYRVGERSWTEGESLESFTAKAYAAVGRDPSEKSTTIQVARMWSASPQVSPTARSVVKTKAIEFDCLNRLRRKEPIAPIRVGPSPEAKRIHNGKRKAAPILVNDDATSGSITELRVGHFPGPLELLKDLEDADPVYDSDGDISPRKKRKREAIYGPGGVAGTEDELPRVIRPIPGIFPRANSVLLPEAPLARDPAPLLAVSPSATPPSSPIQAHITPKNAEPEPEPTAVTMGWLLADSFILVHGSMYPRTPLRLKARLALKQILPENRLLSTLEALLVGISWTPRKVPLSETIAKGVIFADVANVQRIITELKDRSGKLKAGPEKPAKIFLVSKDYLDVHGKLDLNTAVDVLWESQ